MTCAHSQVEQVALYLGHPWKFNRLREPCNWSYEIMDGSGRGLYFRIDGQKFKISGMFPRQKTTAHRADYHTIGVSIARPAKDIAADIMRRLLPHYLQSYDKATLRYAEEQEKKQRLDLIAQALASFTGGRIAEHGSSARTVYFDNATAEIWSNEHITLDLRRLSIEQAIQIAALITHSERRRLKQ